MGLREQDVVIGASIHIIKRNVHDVQNNDELQFQTGYVSYDNSLIPVWRPLRTLNKTEIEIKIWRNIYNLRMPQKRNSKFVEYNVVGYRQDDILAMLPEVQITLMPELRNYIQEQIYGAPKRKKIIYKKRLSNFNKI